AVSDLVAASGNVVNANYVATMTELVAADSAASDERDQLMDALREGRISFNSYEQLLRLQIVQAQSLNSATADASPDLASRIRQATSDDAQLNEFRHDAGRLLNGQRGGDPEVFDELAQRRQATLDDLVTRSSQAIQNTLTTAERSARAHARSVAAL